MKTSSRSGEMQFFGHGDEVLQMTEFHRIVIAKSCYAEALIYWRTGSPATIISADGSTNRKSQHRQTKLYSEDPNHRFRRLDLCFARRVRRLSCVVHFVFAKS